MLPEWQTFHKTVDYDVALQRMEHRVAEISNGTAPEAIWLLEHPPLYTAGTSAKRDDLLSPNNLPVYKTGRGGQYTYHGPGQRVAYVMLNLKDRKPDVRHYVSQLEQWIINTLAAFNIKGERRSDRVGVWVQRPELKAQDDAIREDKIAAIGVRIRKWITFHGISINVDPNLEHFSGIVPCGIKNHGVTSMVELGHIVSLHELDIALKDNFEAIFGPINCIS